MKYDVVVIGSGPGGYVAAIRAAQLGLKTAIIEKYATLGGTCLNVGCIPSKALLDSSEHYHNAAHTFKTHGIELSNLKPNLTQMINRKNEVVKQNTDGINYLMKKNKIDTFQGLASFINKNTIQIDGAKKLTIETAKVIIATGSKPSTLPFIAVDKKRILTSTEALNLKEIPKINLMDGNDFGNIKSSLGGYNPETKEIVVATEGRLTADILRTIAHEMVHRKQDEMGLVRNESDGNDGSPIENNAHAVAGILMREYGRINKQIYTEDINIDVDKGDTVLMGKFKNKKVVVKDIGKDDYGMPTINGKKAATFRLGDKGQNIFKKDEIDEMKSTDVHFMNMIKLYRDSTFRKRINAYLFGNPNKTNPTAVAKALRNMGYDEITQMEKELNIKPDLNESLLLEGGAYGHMSHPFDDMDLTFGDLKDIISKYSRVHVK